MSAANKNTIRMVREVAMRAGNLDRLDGLYTDDYVYHGIPMIGDMHGPDAFKALVTGFVAAVTDFQESVAAQVAEDNYVVTRVTGSGVHTGELMGQPATGNQMRWSAIIISRFVGGRIAEEWAEFDALSFMQQLRPSV